MIFEHVPDRPSDPPEELAPEIVCPFCGARYEMIYYRDGEPVACEECVQRKFWWEVAE